MSTSRKIFLIAGSMAITVLTILCLKQMPLAYPAAFSAAFNWPADPWLHEPFDVRLEREMDTLQYQQHRPMLQHLAMLQIAKQAQAARLRAISKMDRRNWGTAIRVTPTHPIGFGGSGQNKAVYRSPPAAAQKWAFSQNLLVTLLCVGFASIWLLVRRP